MALRYFTKSSTCTTIAAMLPDASHDCVTSMRNGHWSGHTLLPLTLRTLFTVAGGYLLLDDPVVEKPSACRLGAAAWGWSSTHQKVVFGVSVVLLVWTHGQRRLPVAFRVGHQGGLSKFALALERLS